MQGLVQVYFSIKMVSALDDRRTHSNTVQEIPVGLCPMIFYDARRFQGLDAIFV